MHPTPVSQMNLRLSLTSRRAEDSRHKPWHASAAEKKLTEQEPNENTFHAAAEAELSAAKGYKYNSFKIELAHRAIVRALMIVTEMT